MNNRLFAVANDMIKTSKTKKDISEMLAKYLGMLRGLAVIHQTAHWANVGEKYGQHLLFDRLYGNVSGDLDLAAEKIIGVFGEEILPNKHLEIAKEFVDKFSKQNLLQRSLEAEVEFVSFSEELYEKLKDEKEITLGVDDMIMSISSKHEENIYLLKS